ncbi:MULTISPECIES: DivIVA domain-containing protein [unclassified Agrococcus]|uniref:DivIVA domain-containing protein n=1 Tax=unclassified Agrococcus TaxID=2615065 RepID=UPI00361A8CA4
MSATFPKVRRGQLGYDIEQVEDFLEDARRAYASDSPTALDSSQIRQASFALAKSGYSPAHVDAALERLEEAFANRERERGIAAQGESAFFESIRSQAEETLARLQRADGERFRRVGSLTKGYKVAEVDAFAARLAHYLEDGPEITPREVRTVQFAAQRGGYDEDQVDLVLDSVVSLMLAVR